MKVKHVSFWMWLLCLLPMQLTAQEQVLSGKITDETNLGLPGVNIVVKGTSNGTTTDFDGNYSLNVSPTDTLVIAYVGYVTKMVAVGNKTTFNWQMIPDMKTLDEIVVIGYGTEKKSDVTGSLESLDAESLNKGAATSPEMLLNGRIPEVQMTPNSGQPGAEQNVRIRGVNSISASSEPLYVIDDVPIDNNRSAVSMSGDASVNSAKLNPLSMIAPNDIESMTVLKDASATAIYGSRGANGVIIIKTRSGKEGKGFVTYDGYTSVSTISNKINLLSANEYGSYVSATGGGSTDWQDEIFRSGFTQNHNVSFSGGAENLQYRASLGMLNQEGIVLATGLERMNARLSINQKLWDDKLNIKLNLSNTQYTTDNIIEQQTGGAAGGVINNALKADPTQPVRNADGTYNEYATQVFNPVALAEQIEDVTKGNRLISSIEGEYKIIEGLSAKLNLAYDLDNQSRRIYQPIASAIGGAIGGRAIRDDSKYENRLLETYLNLLKNHQ